MSSARVLVDGMVKRAWGLTSSGGLSQGGYELVGRHRSPGLSQDLDQGRYVVACQVWRLGVLRHIGLVSPGVDGPGAAHHKTGWVAIPSAMETIVGDFALLSQWSDRLIPGHNPRAELTPLAARGTTAAPVAVLAHS